MFRFFKHIGAVVFIFSGFVDMNAQTVTRQDILATVRHIEQLSRQQKSELTQAQQDYEKQGEELITAKGEAKLMAQAAHENAKERDAVIVVASLFVALYFGSMLAGIPLREFPMPWSLIAAAGIYAAIFWVAYGCGRIFLHSAAHFLP